MCVVLYVHAKAKRFLDVCRWDVGRLLACTVHTHVVCTAWTNRVRLISVDVLFCVPVYKQQSSWIFGAKMRAATYAGSHTCYKYTYYNIHCRKERGWRARYVCTKWAQAWNGMLRWFSSRLHTYFFACTVRLRYVWLTDAVLAVPYARGDGYILCVEKYQNDVILNGGGPRTNGIFTYLSTHIYRHMPQSMNVWCQTQQYTQTPHTRHDDVMCHNRFVFLFI